MLQPLVLDSYTDVDPDEWDRLVGDANPFLEHTYLHTLEQTGCATEATGWLPRPVVVRNAEGAIVGACPGWLKTHSMGEFVYDHAWADAAHRASIPYYPKLIVGLPFTPVTGPRMLIAPGADNEAVRRALLQGLNTASEDACGLHVLFNTDREAAWLADEGVFTRLQFQFHWRNEGFKTFEDWLSTFPSKRRNKVRRERKALSHLSFENVQDPSPSLLAAMHKLYSNTCEQFGPWGRVYLSPEVFSLLGERWKGRLQMLCAWEGNELVGAALNVYKNGALFGRYWGCQRHIPFLHFEVCYYQPVEHSIANGWQRFEPGHGGGHKYLRGFVATTTYSSHAFGNPLLQRAFQAHATEEAEAVVEHMRGLDRSSARP